MRAKKRKVIPVLCSVESCDAMQSNAEFNVLAKSQSEPPDDMLMFGPNHLKVANSTVGLKIQLRHDQFLSRLQLQDVARTFDPRFGTCLRCKHYLGCCDSLAPPYYKCIQMPYFFAIAFSNIPGPPHVRSVAKPVKYTE